MSLNPSCVALFCSVLFSLLTLTPTAHADDGSNSPWSIGAGLNSSLTDPTSSLGGRLTGSHLFLTPGVSFLTEYRLSPDLALMFDLTGSFAVTDHGDERHTLMHLLTEVGTRFVLTDRSPIEVSFFGSVFGSVYKLDFDSEGQVPFEAKGGGLRAGIVAERELAKNLALRFSTPLIEVSAFSIQDDTTAIRADVVLQPSIELRLSF